jgi:DNA-binding beta-propeller fold protein YncE
LNPPYLTRRGLLLSTVLSACGRTRAPRYQGWLFVGSEAEKGVVVSDLAEFKRVVTIPLGEAPHRMLVCPAGLFAACSGSQALYRIDPARPKVSAKIGLPGQVVATALVGESAVAAVLLDHPAALMTLDLPSGKILSKGPLPAGLTPLTLAVSSDLAAVTAGRRVLRFAPKSGVLLGQTDVGSPPGPIVFRNDGQTILAGLPGTREIVILDAATGGLLNRLPLAIAPQHFCFNRDGGQMFVTGLGLDALVIANPYQNEIDQTISAGHEPGAMAVQAQQNILLVANPSFGNVTLLDIDTRRLAATIAVNGPPGEILVTPDGEYALVVSRDSGDVSVIRLATVLDRKQRTKPVFTVFPTGAGPRSAAIVPFAA